MDTDEIALKAQLRQLKMEEKKRKRDAKLAKKLDRQEAKKAKKSATLKAKVEAGKIKLPPESTKKPGAAEPPEAEIIETTPKEWAPVSSKSMDEKRARIDRLSAEGVKSLKMRFREKYGEELEVPDMYEKSYDLDLGEPSDVPGVASEPSEPGELKAAEPGEKKRWGAKASKPKPKGDRPLRFFDLRHPLFFKDKFTNEESGGGKKAMMLIVDILMYIIFPILILRIITTIIYVIKDGRAAKRAALESASSPKQLSEVST